MLIVRETFIAKPGQAGKLAKLFKRAFAGQTHSRVLTDFIGNYNTVVMEMEVENLAAFEEQFNQYKAGNMGDIEPEVLEELKNYTQFWESGKREVFQVV
jgi:hypothetical protein